MTEIETLKYKIECLEGVIDSDQDDMNNMEENIKVLSIVTFVATAIGAISTFALYLLVIYKL